MVDLSQILRKRITREIDIGKHYDWILFNYDKTKKNNRRKSRPTLVHGVAQRI